MSSLGAIVLLVAAILTFATRADAVIDADTESACHNAFGRWVTVTMKDAGIPFNGWEGNHLHFQDDQLNDLHAFTLGDGLNSGSESFCLDYFGDEFSKCYTIYMDDEGYNPQQVSWTVKITTRNNGAEWRTVNGVDQWVSRGSGDSHGWNSASGVMEAIKEGGSPADVKVLCGRLFKKLGRYSMKQIDKAGIDTVASEDNMLYKSQNAMAKIEAHAQMLNLFASDSDAPSAVDADDWRDSSDGTTTTAVADTTAAATTTTKNLDCNDCPSSCTGCAVKSWRGDGQCDDDNNNCGCNWDGGDCCNTNAETLYCTDCECLDPDFSRALRG